MDHHCRCCGHYPGCLYFLTLKREYPSMKRQYRSWGTDTYQGLDKNEDVAIPLCPGTGTAWRKETRQRIAQNADRLLGNGLPVEVLGQCLLSRFAAAHS